LAAIVSVAAIMPESLMPVCKPSTPVSVMFIQAQKIRGRTWKAAPWAAIMAEVFRWRMRSSSGVISTAFPLRISTELPEPAGDGTRVRRDVYAGGNGTEVVVYTIEGGGHNRPGGPQYLPVFLVGKASRNLEAMQ
jgi:poly(3-hydroxybutyrate) depolymerase